MTSSFRAVAVIAALVAAPSAGYGQGQFSDWTAIQTALNRVPGSAGTVYDSSNWSTNHIKVYNFHVLAHDGPHNVSFSLNRLRSNYHYNAHANDGRIFRNDGNYLPFNSNPNYYHEFVEWPSLDTSIHPFGVANFNFPGPMRLLLGNGGEMYFSGDHYGADGLAPYRVSPVPEPAGLLAVAAFIVAGFRLRRIRRGPQPSPC